MKRSVKRTWVAAILCARSWIIGAEKVGELVSSRAHKLTSFYFTI
jgi:hypothetical protein